MKYKSHKDISFSEGAGIQITELSLELKSAVKLKRFWTALDYFRLIPWLPNLFKAVAAPLAFSSKIQQSSSKCQLIMVKYKNLSTQIFTAIKLLFRTDIELYVFLQTALEAPL